MNQKNIIILTIFDIFVIKIKKNEALYLIINIEW